MYCNESGESYPLVFPFVSMAFAKLVQETTEDCDSLCLVHF